MAVYFFDTSALVKYYHEESGRPKVVDLIEDPASSIHISRLSHVEWHSAFARHVRTGAVSAEEFHRLRGRFYADLKTGKFQTVPLHNTHLQRASRLLSTHALTRGLRTLDALQLTIALDLPQRGRCGNSILFTIEKITSDRCDFLFHVSQASVEFTQSWIHSCALLKSSNEATICSKGRYLECTGGVKPCQSSFAASGAGSARWSRP